jgi:hypothetical protein
MTFGRDGRLWPVGKPSPCPIPLQRQALAIDKNSSALKLAPPTNAPSTSAALNNACAFDGFTEPP